MNIIKQRFSLALVLLMLTSCSTPNNLNNISSNSTSGEIKNTTTIVSKPGDNSDPNNTLVSKPGNNGDPNNTLVSKPGDNGDPNNNLVSKPGDNGDPNNTLVSKPGSNSDPDSLVSKPGDNSDPLVVIPDDNIDPSKVSFIKGKGYGEINFKQGNYDINLNVDLTELSVFKVQASNSKRQNTESLIITVKLGNKYNNKFKLDKDQFIDQTSIMISIKGLKDSSDLYVDISAKDQNNNSLAEKVLFNQKVNGNQSSNASLFKESNSSNNNSINATTPNTSTVNNSNNSQNNNAVSPTPSPASQNNSSNNNSSDKANQNSGSDKKNK